MINEIVSMNKVDPTHTLTLRKKFSDNIVRRFRELDKEVKELLYHADVFGLGESRTNSFGFGSFGAKVDLASHYSVMPLDQKVDTFMLWFDKEMARSFEDQIGMFSPVPADRNNWVSAFIYTAYAKGIAWGRTQLRQNKELMSTIGEVQPASTFGINSPASLIKAYEPHSEALASLQDRANSDLEGIQDVVSTQVRREVMDGLIIATTPLLLYKAISDRIKKVGEHRGNLLGRSEIIRAHHIAAITEYERLGVTHVRISAEWVTAGDSRVCPDCKDMEGRVFTLVAIRNLIPLHPLCRCAARPTLKKPETFN